MEFLQQYSGILALIILLVALVLFVRFYPENEEEEEENEDAAEVAAAPSASPLNIDDEDATVACLVAAIECRNQYHKNVQIVSVREVK